MPTTSNILDFSNFGAITNQTDQTIHNAIECLIIPGDIKANIHGIKTGDQLYRVRAHMWYLRSLFLAHNVPKYL